jgi:hypothetical protein
MAGRGKLLDEPVAGKGTSACDQDFH